MTAKLDDGDSALGVRRAPSSDSPFRDFKPF
jgi:hypothetical protein